MRKWLGKILIIIGIVGVIAYIVLMIIARTNGIEDGSLLDKSNLFPNLETRTPGGIESGIDFNETTTTEEVTTTETESIDGTTPLARLNQISPEPISGAMVYSTEETITINNPTELIADGDNLITTAETSSTAVVTTPVIRFIDHLSGFIHETRLESGLPTTQLTETSIFNVYDGGFSGDGETVFMRFYNEPSNTIQTFIGQLVINEGTSYCPFTLNTTIRPGDTNRSVEDIQQILQGTAIPIDTNPEPGVYDAATLALVTTFQRSVGLVDDGIVGLKTREALITECNNQQSADLPEEKPYILSNGFLPENIASWSISPDGDYIAYNQVLIDNTSQIVTTSLVNSSKTNIIWSVPFSEWDLVWANKDTIAITTRAASNIPGYLYLIDLKSGSRTRVLGDINGLQTLISPSGDFVFYSQSTDNGLINKIYNLETKEVTDVSFRTFPEKCVWSKQDSLYCGVPQFLPEGNYPEDWYIGGQQFTDKFINYDPITKTTTEVAVPAVSVIDSIRPQLALDDTLLLFTNQRDLTLWSYQL